jgi:cytochrome c-type biogenesis protein CcmH/NrfG
MAEVALLVMALALAGAGALAPLWRRPTAAEAEPEVDNVRHRVALEALRDLEADRRAGLFDDETYARLLADAEARAAETDAMPAEDAPAATRPARPLALAAAGIIAVALVLGMLVPGTGIANGTVVNQALAEARASEQARQDRIRELTGHLAESPEDAETLSQLAEAYLAGSSATDLQAAAAALQLLIAQEPDRADAYERIIAAYLRAGDDVNARAALTSYAERSTADAVEVAFFDGLIALRGENDAERAREAFDRFLELAPDDPRAGMIRGLRDEAATRE